MDDERWDLNEDTHEGTTYKFKCPAGCLYSESFNMLEIVGAMPGYYADTVPLCAAAAHSGVIRDAEGGYFVVHVKHMGIAPHAFTRMTPGPTASTRIVSRRRDHLPVVRRRTIRRTTRRQRLLGYLRHYRRRHPIH